MNIYMEANKQLAELLGWTNVQYNTHYHNRLSGDWKDSEFIADEVPDWAGDDAEAFRLMVEYEAIPIQINDDDFVTVIPTGYNQHKISDHTDKLQAMRYAIVQAVIQKLKASSS